MEHKENEIEPNSEENEIEPNSEEPHEKIEIEIKPAFGDQRPSRPPVAAYYRSINAIARSGLRIDRARSFSEV